MKRMRVLKWLIVAGAAILLSLLAGAAVSAASGIGIDSGTRSLPAVMEQIFADWRGSKSMIAIAVLCIVLAIAGKGIEKR